MLNATIEVGLHMDILSANDGNSEITCRNKQLLSSEDGGNVVITEIRFPLKYDDVDTGPPPACMNAELEPP